MTYGGIEMRILMLILLLLLLLLLSRGSDYFSLQCLCTFASLTALFKCDFSSYYFQLF